MIGSVEARNISLDLAYGPNRGTIAPDSHELALIDETGAELTDANSPGYARATILPAAWPPADQATKTITVTLDPPTDEWVPAVAWRLIGDDGLVWDEADLVDPLLVTIASTVGPVVTVTVFYETN